MKIRFLQQAHGQPQQVTLGSTHGRKHSTDGNAKHRHTWGFHEGEEPSTDWNASSMADGKWSCSQAKKEYTHIKAKTCGAGPGANDAQHSSIP